ncbi:hypothetical protein [Nitratireductor sp. ZSWI3]|uniref:hypothetical protein n=1 Tax=Nitratireductor sp. ZSWI3 TaxID=2966359 RepID=UPI00214F923B|nr:hypothetical protein [Nitratireductor sp. ZSWI3]MCR4265870.1 hypothetical protein [Nitratireductor sp. ZSWI3]
MSYRKLTDDEVYEALHQALLALGRREGATRQGETALKAARRALRLLQMGLVSIQERASEEMPSIKFPD